MDAAQTPVLLIDSAPDFAEAIRPAFALQGFRLDVESDGIRGLVAALGGRHALVLLEVALPGIDGFQLLRRLRRSSDVPVIVVTAQAAPQDRIVGFEAGADDYLQKAVGADELLARIRAVLWRAGRGEAPARAPFKAGGLEFHPMARQAVSGGATLELTSIQYDILECLARSAGRVVSRDALAGVLHQRDAAPFDRSVDVHIHHIRRRLGRRRSVIRTVRGEGYLLTSGQPSGSGGGVNKT